MSQLIIRESRQIWPDNLYDARLRRQTTTPLPTTTPDYDADYDARLRRQTTTPDYDARLRRQTTTPLARDINRRLRVASGEPLKTRFVGSIGNVTVTVGRDASLSCTVEDLGEHKVGWIHLHRQMIVAVHTRMISRISRYSVTHDSHKTWTLHITGVTEEDSGYYMCQVNTDPALSQVGLLQVVVPPNIMDEQSSNSEIQVREKANVTLRCAARGNPEPRIMWKREDGAMIVTNTRNPGLRSTAPRAEVYCPPGLRPTAPRADAYCPQDRGLLPPGLRSTAPRAEVYCPQG
ncbi:uncharacterized protein [Panulirus ornatus]|uniref:uncharacterized protein n=1 Tax=Panulirus ornatus TaxID=150431 RepID=UPI003A8405AF